MNYFAYLMIIFATLAPSVRDVVFVKEEENRVSLKTSMIVVGVEVVIFVVLEIMGIDIIDYF